MGAQFTRRSILASAASSALLSCGCTGGGDPPPEGGSDPKARSLYYQLGDGGGLTSITYVDRESQVSVAVQTTTSNGISLFTSASATAADGTFNISFDESGRVFEITKFLSGERVTFNYFVDHIEFVTANGAGTVTKVQVLFEQGAKWLVGEAVPGTAYDLAMLSNVTDVTTTVNSILSILPAKAAAASTEGGVRAMGNQATSPMQFNETAIWAIGVAIKILLIGIVGVIGYAAVAGCVLAGPLVCSVAVVELAAIAASIISMISIATAAEPVPDAFDGVYTSSVLFPDGYTHTERNIVKGLTITAHSDFTNGVLSGAFDWLGTIIPTSASAGRIVGAGYVTNQGVRKIELLESSNISMDSSGLETINWGAIDSKFGPIGSTSKRH